MLTSWGLFVASVMPRELATVLPSLHAAGQLGARVRGRRGYRQIPCMVRDAGLCPCSVGANIRTIAWVITCGVLTRQAAAAEELDPTPRRASPIAAAGLWAAAQLIPSPLLVMSSHHVGGGVRWQVTPLLYSFGVTAHPWRAFVVPPSVRHSGSIELYGSPEWVCCAPQRHSSWLGRVGSRVYLPLLERGESLSWSFGGSYYRTSATDGGAAELGIYTLYGVFGVTVTISPTLARREVIAGLSVRYF